MHYYKPKAPGRRTVIPVVVRGVAVQLISYTSLFSGTSIDEGTMLLLENIRLPEEGVVLDVGCGYGAIGVVVARLNPRLRVYMTDINPLAVKVSRQNARLNGVEGRVVVLRGDRYEPVGGLKFDAIYSNPPLSAGMQVVKDIVLGAAEHLKGGGHAQFVLARGGEHLAGEARKVYSHVEAVSKKGYILLYLKP